MIKTLKINKLTLKDIKLIGKPYEDYGDEWHQEFSVDGIEFDSLYIDLIDDKYMPHINPHEADGEGNSIKEQCLNYVKWYAIEFFEDDDEVIVEE